jgi:hypothetical protein
LEPLNEVVRLLVVGFGVVGLVTVGLRAGAGFEVVVLAAALSCAQPAEIVAARNRQATKIIKKFFFGIVFSLWWILLLL